MQFAANLGWQLWVSISSKLVRNEKRQRSHAIAPPMAAVRAQLGLTAVRNLAIYVSQKLRVGLRAVVAGVLGFARNAPERTLQNKMGDEGAPRNVLATLP
jgi:hypothetical protein